MKFKVKKFLESENIISAALTSVLVTTSDILNRPGIQASLKSLEDKILLKGNEEEIPEGALVNAEKIIRLLKSKRILFKRIGVDGVPGSGKTSLSRALAKLTGMKWHTLDGSNLEVPCDLSEISTIYENHRLFRTQDIDNFDVIIYIDEPIELSKKKVIKRKKAGIVVDVLNYDKLKRIGELAFKLADGKYFDIPDSYIKLKIRPENGYKQIENIKAELAKQNITLKKSYSKEELLFLLSYGQPKKGLIAYINLDAYNKELLNGIKAGLADFLGRNIKRTLKH